MSLSRNVFIPLLFVLLATSQHALAQRRVFTNEDIQPAAPPMPTPAPAQPSAAPGAQPAGSTVSPAPAPAGNAAAPQDENAARRAEAEKMIQRMEEIRTAMREAGDIFFDKIREGKATQPTVNKWNQVRDNLVMASDELALFINEARRNLPPPAVPVSPAAKVPQ